MGHLRALRAFDTILARSPRVYVQALESVVIWLVHRVSTSE
jgi:hypothetical protein